jgi:DNA helicase-2/ATP-dependent DNA helicase PcrA
MSKFVPSPYQQAIYDFITNGNGNAVVSAVAGSGKTTTLINAIKLIPQEKSVVFFAFNKSIVNEIQERVPQNAKNIDVKTLHSYGYSALRNSFKNIEIKNNKYKQILNDVYMFSTLKIKNVLAKYKFSEEVLGFCEQFFIDEEIEDKVGYLVRIQKLCDLGRVNLINLKDMDSGINQLNTIAKKHNIEIINGECFNAWLLINIGATITSEIDFTDMVFMPVHYKINFIKYDIVFIDECQDLNACQRELMKKAIKFDGGRFVAVGDPAQAIYGFSGADAESFRKLQNIKNTITLPLSVSYRCGSDIVSHAQRLMPQIEASENAKKGIVDFEASWNNIKTNDMVVCRNVFPLVKLCLKLLTLNKKAYIMGTDISANLIKLVESTERKTEPFVVENIFKRIYNEKNKLVLSISRKEKLTLEEAKETSTVKSLEDKILCLETLSEGVDTGVELIDKLKQIFSDETDGICLSSIHKSKGLESDRVFIIQKELMPSKYATQDWQIEQERNLEYVAITRAKSYLGYVSDFDAYEKHNSKETNEKVVDKVSNFVGKIGEKSQVTLQVVEVKEMNTSYGDTTLYTLIDSVGNIFTKFGKISEKFIISAHHEIVENCYVEFFATIKAHNEYKGVKTNVISTISKAK